MKVKQDDIAKKLGISRTTVARALNGSGSIKESTRESIIQLAEEMGYIKDTAGSLLATKKEKIIYIFLVESINSHYLTQLKKGFKAVEEEYSMVKTNFKIIETSIDKPNEQIIELKKAIANNEINGIIITPLLKNEVKAIVNKFKDSITFLMLDSKINDKLPFVGVDYFYNAQISASLIDLALRKEEKVLMLNSYDDHISSEQYRNGFLEQISKTNKTIINIGEISKNTESIYELVEPYLKNKEKIAIYTSRFTSLVLNDLIRNNVDFDCVKLVAQSKGGEMDLYLTNKSVMAVVEESVDTVAYIAGKNMIEKIFFNKDISSLKEFVKPIIKIAGDPFYD